MIEENKILNTNPLKYILAGLAVIILFFGGLAVWALYLPFQGAVIAPGIVKVSGERKTVQHLEGGIIERIFIKEGDHVSQGDILISLKGSKISSNVDMINGKLWARQAEAARLRAEAAMKSKIKWPAEFEKLDADKEVLEIMATEQEIFDSRRRDIKGKTQLYESQAKQLANRIAGAKEELNSVETIITNLEEDLAAKRPLLKEKYMGKASILELERNLADYKGRRGKLIQDIAQFNQMIQENKLRVVDINNQYKESAVSQLGEVMDSIFELKDQIKPYLDARDRLEIRAPISGIVINMQVHSEESGVIQPGMPLLDIVPVDLKMVIKAQVRPQDIISVKKGQAAKVQLAAFQRKTTPPVNATVTHISPDLISENNGAAVVSYYEAYVEVDPADLASKDAYLSPGMPVTCYITTDKRTVISYVLGPLLKNIDTALRE